MAAPMPISLPSAPRPWLELLEPLAAPQPRPRTAAEHFPPEVDINNLHAEAESLLVSARAEAAELIEDAKIQAESLREAAWQEGFHQGEREARTSVEAELRTAWEARGEALRAEVEAIVTEIASARAALWASQEGEMVALSLDIARQVIKTEVTQNPKAVQAVLANALRRITDKENVRVRVSVAEAPGIKEAREDLLEVVDGLRFLEIVDDRRISPGGCVIETNAGTIDAKIETQLSEVAKALGVIEND
jgi:flagellar assembly protein FliH